jgi:thiamine biosynthesis lipoprotein
MHNSKRTLQKIKTQVQQMPIAKILTQWGRWLGQKKGILVLVLLGVIVCRLTLGRLSMVTLQGEAMCASYCIQYLDRWGRNYQQEIDALLVRLHHSLSASLPDSELSRFNEHDCSEFYFESPFFYPIFAKSKEVYRNTAGAFDPTILPLVNAWEGRSVDTTDPDSLPINTPCEYVSLDYVVANVQRIKKLKEDVRLDFGGMLKGYAVDKIADLLRSHGIAHMWIALGSEAVAYGKASQHNAWHMAIHPHVASLVDTELHITMELVDKAVAISSKKERETLHQARIIDPSTGYPAQHTLLAAVVVSKDCGTADAYATAMMARGLAFAQELLAQQKDLAAFLIYEDDHGAPTFYASSSLHMQQRQHTIILRPTQESS